MTGAEPAGARPLSKQHYLAGRQCHKQLWWRMFDRGAPELVPSAETLATLDEGTRVGVRAREYVPGGTLIATPDFAAEERLRATRAAIDAAVPVLYEGSCTAGGAIIRFDILRRDAAGGFDLIEVKSATKVRDEYLPDVALQLWVLRASGVDVRRAFVMHLNRECRYPDLSNLFVLADVTADVEPLLHAVPGELAALRSMLAGPLPDVAVGAHCEEPRDCPFIGRCWQELPEHHVSTLYRIQRRTVDKHLANGIVTLHQLDERATTLAPAQRQIRAVRAGARIVEPGLAVALRSLVEPVAYLDFETVAPAIPVWDGCRPYDQVPVQFSIHFADGGTMEPRSWLASGAGDPRPALAEALVRAGDGANTVVAYFASFEQQCIAHLADATPALAGPLRAIGAKLVDLLPIVRDHVYDPAFGGSFSLKKVLPALVPELGYEDLEIQQGMLASVELTRLLFGEMDEADRVVLRTALLAYCERDTLAMVRLVDTLRSMS